MNYYRKSRLPQNKSWLMLLQNMRRKQFLGTAMCNKISRLFSHASLPRDPKHQMRTNFRGCDMQQTFQVINVLYLPTKIGTELERLHILYKVVICYIQYLFFMLNRILYNDGWTNKTSLKPYAISAHQLHTYLVVSCTWHLH